MNRRENGTMRLFVALLLLWSFTSLHGADKWKAGVASVNVTPTNSIWLTGFAARTNVSQGKLHDLYVKALALKDSSGNRAVLLSSDLLGFPAEVSERIADRVQKKYRLKRDQLLFNSSHTHGAPAIASSNHFIYGPQASPQQWKDIDGYTRILEDKIVTAIGTALKNMQTAHLSFGQGNTDFGINRRKMTPGGIQSFVPNPDGPIDHSVPVLKVESTKGKPLAIVFGYAAHPTTITGGTHYYDFSADYPGFAQAIIEKEFPGATAMFIQGCGGDVMVYPRGTVEQAQQYGEKLAGAVKDVLKTTLLPLESSVRTDYEKFPVELAVPSRAKLEEQLKTGDLYHRWHAQEMLKTLDSAGALPRTYPYPLQAWQLGKDLTLVALAGEVVVGYSVRLKKELDGQLWVAGYSNDLFAYIPTRRVLEEGGYEGGGAMIYYMQPGPFAPSIEETIIQKSHEVVQRVRKQKNSAK